MSERAVCVGLAICCIGGHKCGDSEGCGVLIKMVRGRGYPLSQREGQGGGRHRS